MLELLIIYLSFSTFLKVILCAVQRLSIHPEKFDIYARQTSALELSMCSWYHLPTAIPQNPLNTFS